MLNQISSLFRSAQTYKFFTVFTAVFLLVVISATVVTFILPETYRGTARIAVSRIEDSPAENPKPAQPAVGDYDPYFIQTEFEVMQSQVVLDQVVKKLGLNEKWGLKFNGGEPLTTAQTTELLRHFIDPRPVRSTSLVEIRTYTDTPEEAANIANAMAEAYRDYRMGKGFVAGLQKPKTAFVEILDTAVPNLVPVRPNKPLNILLGIIMGTVLGLLAGGSVAGISFWRRQNSPPKIAT